ncbi:MAG: PAS domain S-box protein [Firmicutes bacterium]|nr:PAS domain S-box protein [Bacillota bacterium]
MDNTLTWYAPTISAQITIQAVMALVFSYLYAHDRRRFLILWGIGCYGWVLKLSFDLAIFQGHQTAFFLIMNQLGCLIGGFFLGWGAINFIGKKLPKPWTVWVWLCVGWIVLAALFTIPLTLVLLPIALGVLVIYFWTGLAFLRAGNIEVTGQRITGWAFVLTGLHLGNYPLLRNVEWLAPWGYLTAGAMTFLLSIGILLAYYQRIRTSLTVSETRLRMLAENSPDLIYRYRLVPTPGFDYVSPAALAITGYTPDDFYAGRADGLKLVPGLENPAFPDSGNTHPGIGQYQQILREDGSAVFIEQRSTVVVDDRGRPVAVEGIARDITERIKAEEELLRMEKSRTHLLTNISHDLRTPLSTVQGYVKAMLDQVISKPEEQNEYLHLIYNRVLKINRLIQDLFELSQLESRRVKFNLCRVAVSDMVSQLFDKYRVDVQDAGLDFILNTPEPREPGLPEMFVEVDPDQIERVFANLIYNAIKHTPPGGTITVGCETVQADVPRSSRTGAGTAAGGFAALVSITDTGAGISPEELPYLFDRYYKGAAAEGKSMGGTGLGLAISKEIVEYHDGRIWAESVLKPGSTFSFTLPAARRTIDHPG